MLPLTHIMSYTTSVHSAQPGLGRTPQAAWLPLGHRAAVAAISDSSARTLTTLCMEPGTCSSSAHCELLRWG